MQKNFCSPNLWLILFLVIAGLAGSFAVAQESDLLTRDQIDDKYKWNFSDIYPDWDAWQADFQKLESMMEEYAALKGSLSASPEALLKAFQLNDEIDKISYLVYRYPALQSAVDTRDNEIAGKLQEAQNLFARFGTKSAWFTPELLAIPWETMKSWLDNNEALAPYRFGIEDLYRQQEHVLSEDKEQLLSYFSSFSASPASIWSSLSTTDIEYKPIELSSGDSSTITSGTYRLILATNRNQADRAKAFDAYYGVYHANRNTYASIYNSVLQRDWAVAQARGYGSCLEEALNGDNVPVEIYQNLVRTVREGGEPYHRYNALRKEKLGLETYHGYDGNVPLVDYDKTYEFDEAADMVVEAVAPLGKEYQQMVRHALDNRWVDVYETPGKRGGAFSGGTYGVHPFILMNYNKTLDNVFTLAHELGHAMHTVLSERNQPKASSGYTLFVAEVASNVNERLLMEYMMNRTTDPVERAALLQQQIEGLTGSFYTQVMFADYVMQAHEMVEQNKPITAESLSELYGGLLQNQNGPGVTFDSLYGSTWTRILHFYNYHYYVYKYATSYAVSAKIASAIMSKDKAESKAALERYMTLLKSGGNDYPMDQIRKAGVDLAEPATVQAAVDLMDNLVTRYAKELDKL